jgi:hypothetical protein
MLLVSTGAVGDNTRYVAHVFRRVAGHLLAATRSYLDVARRWCGCGRWHSARCRRLLSRCRAPVGRYPMVVGTFLDAARVCRSPSARCSRRPARYRAPAGRYRVVVGTLLHAPRLWEMALVTLPTSSGVLPGSPALLPVASATFPVSSTLFPRPSCTLSFFHRRRACPTCRVSHAFAGPTPAADWFGARRACALSRHGGHPAADTIPHHRSNASTPVHRTNHEPRITNHEWP